MITQTTIIRQTQALEVLSTNTDSWQQQLADVIRDPAELCELLQIDPRYLAPALAASEDFPLRVPRAFVGRMVAGDINDPLLRQVLPLGEELDYQPGFTADPLQEAQANPAPGLIHKYHGRVLLVVSGGCAINCRYCFRRHFPYEDNNPSRRQWQQTLDYIRADDSIQEVIFSGGDPLAAGDKLLAELASAINDIPHVTTLRIHSRLPVVIPQRISEQCLQWLKQPQLQTVMVIHSNHANEIDAEVGVALMKLKQAGISLLNQAVLLAGVNDDSNSLTLLSQRLFQYGVLPYYLHLLDRVQGAAHFQVNETQALQLVAAMRDTLPGYLVPRLVKEEPGASSKTPIR
jgi:EF-P beta-lysylation protein EpmB